MNKILPILLTPLLLALNFWRFFTRPGSIWWVVVISLLILFIMEYWLAGKYFWNFLRLWFNLGLVFISQILFMILLTNDVLRYWLMVGVVILWGIIFWLLATYFKKLKNINDPDYLAFNRFLYYFSFWLLACSFYYLIIFISFSLFYSVIFLLLAAYFWTKDILALVPEIEQKGLIWLVLLTLAEILIALYLLPISFYVAGTVATLWWFFVLEWYLSHLRHYIRYFLGFLGVIILLFISAIF